MNLLEEHCKVILSHAEFKVSSQTEPKLFATKTEKIVNNKHIFSWKSLFCEIRLIGNIPTVVLSDPKAV